MPTPPTPKAPSPRDRRVVVLLSGGLDSTTVLWHFLSKGNTVLPVAFDYGQRHAIELTHARDVVMAAAAQFPERVVELRVLDATWLKHIAVSSSQTNREIAVPHGHYTDETMRVTVVPNRNMIMIAAATAYAMERQASIVAIGAHDGDHAIYADCRPEFLRALGEAVRLQAEGALRLQAPFVNMTKSEIAAHGNALGAPLHLTWSCYDPHIVTDEPRRTKHCGKCGTCVERKEAFDLACVVDRTEYADGKDWPSAIPY